jgi:hypothetical protein
MLNTEISRLLLEPSELVVVWVSSDGARCVLAILDGVMELRLENDGTVIRRAHHIDIRPACDAAQQWRIDWDIGSRSRRVVYPRITCPECGDDAFKEKDLVSGIHWLGCASCGNAWTFDDTHDS